jgi:hypothetical protein
VWQHDLLQNGVATGGELPQDIDRQIRLAGTQLREPTMWLTLGETARPLADRRWRSITSVLSTTSIDLSRSEYIEFYLKTGDAPGKSVIIDVGSVSEDAFYFNALGALNGPRPDGATWGLGFLDEEARLANREIWGPDKDEFGLWDETCTGAGINTPPQGDPIANCARKNGLPDTEDLDGNGVIDDQDGPHFRYVIPLDALSPYLVRDRAQTETNYQLYRVPLRDGLALNGAGPTTWRFVKHLRLTVTSSSQNTVDQFVVARMRIVGSRWIKRDVDGVNRGLLSDEKGLSAGIATIQVGPVGRLTHGGEYASPPNIGDQVQDPSSSLGGGATEINEKGLSIKYSGLGADERADVYFRYPQQPRSFMNYRQMQLWAVARSGNFGSAGDQRLVVKAGTDARNYYLYQSRLNPSVASGAVTANDWLPQITIDFEQWFELKAKAELALLNGDIPAPPAGQPYTLFSDDSTYAIVFEDRARAPNLAAVRELSFGVYNGSTNTADGEVWLNDIRLGAAFRDAGVAGNVTLDIRGGDFLNAQVQYANQGAVFRQLNQDPSYLASGDLMLNTSAQLGQLMPASWGVDMPVSVMHSQNSQDPTLLQSTDVQAVRLPGLRETGSSATRVGLSVRKRTPSSNPIASAIIDGMSLRLAYNTGDNSSITLRNEASGFDGTLAYSREIKPHDFDVMPGFIEAMLRFLAPASVEKGDFFKRLTGSRLRYTPARLSLSTSYFSQERRAYQFSSILVTENDGLVIPIESPRRTMDSEANIRLQPFTSLVADISLRTTRDLLSATRASTQRLERDAISGARNSLAGVDVGWETNRSLATQLNFRPVIASWFRPSATLSTRFGTDRSPSYLEIVTIGADTTAVLQRRFQADRQLRRQLEFTPYGFYQTIAPDTTGFTGFVGRVLRTIQPVTLGWNGTLGSSFDRKTLDPSFRYQLALGDLQSFRVLGVDSAAAATETGRFDAATSVRFLRAAQFDVLYARSELQAFDQRGGSRLEHERTWPNVRLNWANVPLPGFVRGTIPQVSLSGSYQIRRRDQALGRSASSDRGSRDEIVPFTARLTLAGGMAVIYTGNWSRGTSDDPTGDAKQGGLSHNVNFTATFRPSKLLGDKLKEPLRANIGLTQNTQHQCRFNNAIGFDGQPLSNCVAFIDFRNRTANFTLDTNVSNLIVGLQMGYTSRQDFIGTRRVNSQFNLGIFANFELPVGQLPTAGQTQVPGIGGGGLR